MNIDLREIRLYLGTPVHDARVTLAWLGGCLATHGRFHGRIQVDVHRCSYLPMGRDVISQAFLESNCTHALLVDSDIGWTVNDVALLLAARRDFIAGCYAKKNEERPVVAKVLPPEERADPGDAALVEAEYVGAGFLLLTRAVAEQMRDGYRGLRYLKDGKELFALWSSSPGEGRYDSEDIAFCRRWRALGGRIWLHRGIQLQHIGDQVFLPQTVRVSEGVSDAA